MEARKVQRVGYSTLTISLPKGWVDKVKLKAGDTISIKREDDDSLKLIPRTEQKQEEFKNCTVHADLCNSPNLLTRVITSQYILGNDTIQIAAKDRLKKHPLDEIRGTTQQLTGLSIVEQTHHQITLQSFVDTPRYQIYDLMRRLHIILSSMMKIPIKALVEKRPELAMEVHKMEEESDKIYWLIVRQLLLAVRDRSAGPKMGIKSPLHILGNRVVAKTLEEMTDCAENIANEVTALEDKEIDEMILNDIVKFANEVSEISDQSMKALLTSNIQLSNDAIERVQNLENEERMITQKMVTRVKDVASAVSLRAILLNLGQMNKYCRMIGEVTFNRAMEAPSDICKYDPVQKG